MVESLLLLFVFNIVIALSMCQSSRSVLNFLQLRPRPQLVASHQSSTPTLPQSSGCCATGPSSSSSSLTVSHHHLQQLMFVCCCLFYLSCIYITYTPLLSLTVIVILTSPTENSCQVQSAILLDNLLDTLPLTRLILPLHLIKVHCAQVINY